MGRVLFGVCHETVGLCKGQKALIAKLQSVYKSIGIKFPKVDSSSGRLLPRQLNR